LAVVFGVALLLRAPIAAIPLERDEGEYAYIGQRWLQGEVPYKTSFDQKPPGVFAAYAMIQLVIGTSPAALHWGMQLYTLGTLTLLYLLGRRLFSPTVGLLAALFAAFLTADKGVLGNAANTEIYMLLPLTGAMLTTVRAVQEDAPGWAFTSGILCAAALLFKQVAVFDVAFYLGVVFCFGPRRWVLVRSVFLGLAAGILPVLAYFAAAGAWRDFVDCTVGYNLAYAREVPLSRYPHEFWDKFSGILETARPAYALTLVGIVSGCLRRPAAARIRRPGLLIVAWLVCSCLGVSSGGTFRHHYFIQIIPAVALLAALGTVALTALLPWRWPRVVAPWAVAAGVIAFAVAVAPGYWLPGSPDEKSRLLYHRPNPFPEDVLVARYLRENSDPSDLVFVFGSEPQIYYYAGRRCASHYIFMYPLTMAMPRTGERQRAVAEELVSNLPRYIVWVYSEPSFLWHPKAPREELEQEVGELVKHAYHLVAVVPLSDQTPMPLLTERREDVKRARMQVFERNRR
jgi:hypothetical protein